MKNFKIWPFVLLPLLLLSGVLMGAGLGIGLAMTINTINTENLTEFKTNIPTRLLDINGERLAPRNSRCPDNT